MKSVEEKATAEKKTAEMKTKNGAEGKIQVAVCVCGTPFPETYSMFCRKCGTERPEPQEEMDD